MSEITKKIKDSWSNAEFLIDIPINNEEYEELLDFIKPIIIEEKYRNYNSLDDDTLRKICICMVQIIFRNNKKNFWDEFEDVIGCKLTNFQKNDLGDMFTAFCIETNKYTFIAPVDWTITENNGMIVARYEGNDEKYKYKNIDIFIVPCGDLRNEEYPTTYKIRNTGFAIARDRIEYKLDGALYNIFDNEAKEDIEMENETILFQSYKITMTRKDGRAGSITPASAVYYKFIDTTGYGIFVFGPEDQELAVDEIAKSVINNFKENIPEEIDVTNYIFPQFKNEVY